MRNLAVCFDNIKILSLYMDTYISQNVMLVNLISRVNISGKILNQQKTNAAHC